MKHHYRSTEPIETQLEKSQQLIAQLNKNCFDYREKNQELMRRLEACETKAVHFDTMMRAVNENQVVRGAWEKFMMTLRIAGYDKTSK